jgi:EAL domain-containing protein (putative c-di-GMP-specific phosphodiesterase class I)/GGDEF domain-containing protein
MQESRIAFLHALDARLESDADRVVVVRVDLDRFPRIARTFGEAVADQVWTELAARARTFVATDEELLESKHDGSMTGILSVEDVSPDSIERLGMAMIASETGPIILPGQPPISVGCNVGMSSAARLVHPDPFRLIGTAEAAVQQANAFGSRRAVVYRVARVDDPNRPVHVYADMLPGIHEGRFRPCFQPIVTLPDRRVVALEGLLRWDHPVLGAVAPGDFLPEAEESGLIRDIDVRGWDAAARVVADLDDPDLLLHLNVAAADFEIPDLVDVVGQSVSRSGLDPRRLVFDVAETAMALDWSRARRQLVGLKSLGASLAVDNFGGEGDMLLDRLGTGLFTWLKIDRGLLFPSRPTSRSDALVDGLVAMAHGMGMRVVGEGIESEAQLLRAIEAGCDYGQGFLFSVVLREDELAGALRDSNAS